MKFTFADLCAGIGGFRIGLENIGGKCIYSCDIDKNAEKTYFDNFNSNYESYDIFDIDSKKFPNVDILCSGFPCQPFSIAGNKKGLKDDRSLVFYKIMEIASESKPKVIFLENVPNIISHDEKETFNKILNEINSAGYDCYHNILDSSNFGVPQSRKRIYFVCFRKDIFSLHFSVTNKKCKPMTVKDILNINDYSIPISKKWESYIDLYTGKISLDDIEFEIPKTRISLERIDSNINLNDCIFQIRSSGIRALSIDKPFPTLAVSVSGGGAMIPVYSKERRHLNLIELKRIMGFSDNFKFPVSRTNAIKQLSNSVCPPVIESIGKDIIFTLESNKVNNFSVA